MTRKPSFHSGFKLLVLHQLFPQITDSSGHILYNMEDASKGTFAFTTEEDDTFDVCFESHSPMGGNGF